MVAVLGVFAASASALPARFFGVVPQSEPTAEQFKTLAKGGVKTMRIPIEWAAVQPSPRPDQLGDLRPVRRTEAAKNNIELLPFLTSALPAGRFRRRPCPRRGGAKAPAHLPVTGTAATAWSNFLKAAVARYGPNGAFWSENPLVPAHPITNWQIWNEPNFKYFVAKPNPTEYGKLVKISSTAIKSVDPSAQVILAGLFAKPAGGRRLAGKRQVADRDQPQLVGRLLPRTDVQDEPGDQDRTSRASRCIRTWPATGSCRRRSKKPGRC